MPNPHKHSFVMCQWICTQLMGNYMYYVVQIGITESRIEKLSKSPSESFTVVENTTDSSSIEVQHRMWYVAAILRQASSLGGLLLSCYLTV